MLPGIVGAFGAAASLVFNNLIVDIAFPWQLVFAFIAGGVGAGVGELVQTHLREIGRRELARLDLPRTPAAGYVRDPGLVVGSTIALAAAELATHLLGGERFLMVEGETGLGKSTMVRLALRDSRILGHFVDDDEKGDRRYAIDFDEVDCSAGSALTVMRERLNKESDEQVAARLRKSASIVILEHVEQFFRNQKTEELERLLRWFHREELSSTRIIIVVQGHRSDAIARMLDAPITKVTLPRLDDEEARELFTTHARFSSATDDQHQPAVVNIVSVFQGLPRAVRLTALAVGAEVNSPLGREPLALVLRRYGQSIHDGKIQGLVTEEGDVLRNASLEIAVRLVLDSHLVTAEMKQVLIELSVFRSGLDPRRVGRIIQLASDASDIGVRAQVGQAYRLGLVYAGFAGVMTEPAVAMHLASEEQLRPTPATTERWCNDAVEIVREPGCDEWLDRNELNLHDAISGQWPHASALAVWLLMVPYENHDEALLLERASESGEALIETAIETVEIRHGPHPGVRRALLREALAYSICDTDWVRCRDLHQDVHQFYASQFMHGRVHRVLTALLAGASKVGDVATKRFALESLGRLASYYRVFDHEHYSSFVDAALDAFRRYLDSDPSVKRDPHRDAHVELELGEIALYAGVCDWDVYESALTAALDQLTRALRAFEQGDCQCAAGQAGAELSLGVLALYHGRFDREGYASAEDAAFAYFGACLRHWADVGAANPLWPTYGMLELGKLAISHGRFDRQRYTSAEDAAFDYFTQCASIYRENDPHWPSSPAEVLFELGKLAISHGRFDRQRHTSAEQTALDCFTQCYDIYRDHTEDWPERLAATLLELGGLAINDRCFDRDRYASAEDAALDTLTECLKLRRLRPDDVGPLADTLLRLGQLALERPSIDLRSGSATEEAFGFLTQAHRLYVSGRADNPIAQERTEQLLQGIAQEITLPDGRTGWALLPPT